MPNSTRSDSGHSSMGVSREFYTRLKDDKLYAQQTLQIILNDHQLFTMDDIAMFCEHGRDLNI